MIAEDDDFRVLRVLRERKIFT